MEKKIYEIGFTKEDFIDDKHIYEEFDKRFAELTAKKKISSKIRTIFNFSKKERKVMKNILENNLQNKEFKNYFTEQPKEYKIDSKECFDCSKYTLENSLRA